MTEQIFGSNTDNPFAERGRIYIFDNGTISPSFHAPLPEAEAQGTLVQKGGEPIAPGFLLSEVTASRRWPVLPGGEVMSQEAFRPLYQRCRSEYYTREGVDAPDMSAEPIPRVEVYVAMRDSTLQAGRLEPITRQYDGDGMIVGAYNQDGTLASEVEAKAPSGPFVPKPKKTPDVKAPGDLEREMSDIRREMSAMREERDRLKADLESRPSVAVVNKELPQKDRHKQQPCGEWVESPRIGNHSRHCAKCKALKAADSES